MNLRVLQVQYCISEKRHHRSSRGVPWLSAVSHYLVMVGHAQHLLD